MSGTGQQPRVERAVFGLTRLPRPVYARVESLPAGSWVRSHAHPWAQLSYAIEGVLRVRTADGSYFAPPQRAVWVPAGVAHEVATSGRAEMRSLYLARRVTRWAPPGCRVLEISGLVRELIAAVTALPVEYDERGPAGRLVRVLLDRLATLPEVAFSLPVPHDARLAGIAGALEHAPHDRRTLAQWSREAGASERTLARLFRAETGLSFREWRQRLRLLAALSALQDGASVTEVALDSGYDSPSAFIATFKRLFGTTPGELQRRRVLGAAGEPAPASASRLRAR
jgi:AraC-like DNA-binding protein